MKRIAARVEGPTLAVTSQCRILIKTPNLTAIKYQAVRGVENKLGDFRLAPLRSILFDQSMARAWERTQLEFLNVQRLRQIAMDIRDAVHLRPEDAPAAPRPALPRCAAPTVLSSHVSSLSCSRASPPHRASALLSPAARVRTKREFQVPFSAAQLVDWIMNNQLPLQQTRFPVRSSFRDSYCAVLRSDGARWCSMCS